MSDDDSSKRPVPEGFASWPDYWNAQGMQWRTEPEIDEERKKYLAERRSVRPNIEKGVYPFKDITLNRADIEWLLETHDGRHGPVDWDDATQRKREGLDLRGANLPGTNLRNLPLGHLIGSLTAGEWNVATATSREMAAVHLEEADLRGTNLNGALLRGAYLQQATLVSTHLEGTILAEGHLGGADLRYAFFDAASGLYHVNLGDRKHDIARLADVRWGGVNLAVIVWSSIKWLGDEQFARRWKAKTERGTLSRTGLAATRLDAFGEAVRANRQLATELRSQGLNEDADRFSYRAQNLQRDVLWGQHKFGGSLFSLLLWALAGYGYRLGRIFGVYALLVMAFAAIFHVLGIPKDPASTTQGHMLNALLVSVTAIHGRVFFEAVQLHAAGVGGSH
jgi:uncharacterized protein YjbI with pentapeptide repeats